ncbi:hypothetical protein ACFQZX_13635 [Mucilaginibacter litoreus]|uniref:Uncharacterized protein n=1 Tax=Mucilaginibacter litoreus TaxID=1048221 RepID=A0ABW3AUP5_9SPHI
MLSNLFQNLFGKKQVIQESYIVVQLNDKIMPIDRGELYEDPLDEFLKVKFYGEVSGGGTLQDVTGEIEYCDVEIKVNRKLSNAAIDDIINKLEALGAPKGSKLIIEETGEQIPLGKLEGMAIYLDGINLSDEIYKNSDPGALAEEINSLIKSRADIVRHWKGETETALYFYGPSFEEMKASISDLLLADPLCENARVVQIA